jgi:5-methylcytosine-specific restriction endonuclease McrA
MQRVFVLDKNKQPLMPCHPARARQLLRSGKAAVFRRYPFTIILKDREDGDIQNVQFKIDPGSKQTGITLVGEFKRGRRVIWAGVIKHHGDQIKKALEKRRMVRRSRRNRKTRYRKPRFLNRKRPEGWLPPSLESRIHNIKTWVNRLRKFCPITSISLEHVKFDTQKMQNPEISGIEYQQGELYGYEVREYLLEKWGRKCAYCGKTGVPLEIEHIVPKSRGGSNRVSNLTLACRECNQKIFRHSLQGRHRPN